MTARGSVVAAFGLHALLVGTLGPRIPAIEDRTGADEGDLGMALAGLAVGLVLGTRVAVLAMRRRGSRRVVRIGIVLMAVAQMGPALARDVTWLAASLAALGVASGLVDVAMNRQAVDVERMRGRASMSGIHAVWGAGMLVGGLLATLLVAAGTSVVLHFAVVSAAVVGLGAAALRALVPHDVAPEAPPGPPAPRRAIVLLGFVAFAALVGEGALADWSALYLDEDVGTSATVAAAAFTLYALGLTVSRLLMDRVVRRFGAVRTVRVAALCAAGSLALGLAVPEPATALVACALFGASAAPIVPLAFSAAGGLGRPDALAWVVAAGYGGAVAGPAIIGLVADAATLRTGLVVVVVAAAAIAPLARGVRTAVA